jgi:hypothetical protein
VFVGGRHRIFDGINGIYGMGRGQKAGEFLIGLIRLKDFEGSGFFSFRQSS